jgi:hypothetical protein
VLITKFNRLIRSKVLWGAFAVIVSLSFIGFMGPRSGCGRDTGPRRGMAGQINGEDIPSRDFLLARFFELGLQERPSMSEAAEANVRERTWKRLLALQTAARMGLRVTPEEIADAIRNDTTFVRNGRFDKQRYDAVLRQLRITDDIYETYLRQELLIRKLSMLLSSMTWTAPIELRRKLDNLTDTFTLDTLLVPRGTFTPAVSVTEDEARAYFAAQPDEFSEPERVNVRYVSFPVSNYLDRAATEVGDTAIADYYEEHIADFTPSDTNAPAEPQPLEEVRDTIRDTLARERAGALARDEATEFVMALTPSRYQAPLSFDEAAAEHDLNIATSAFFSAYEPVPNLDVGYAFNRAAFKLEADDPEAYFSDAVESDHAAYVLAAAERKESYVPEFAAVSNRVFAAARRKAMREAFDNRVKELHRNLAAGVKSTEDFRAIARRLGLNVSTNHTVTVYSGAGKDLPHGDVLVPAIMELQQGELTEPLTVSRGAVIAYVAARVPGDIMTSESLRPQLISTLDRYRSGLLFDAWSEQELVRARFKDYAETPPDDEETDSGEDTLPDEAS